MILRPGVSGVSGVTNCVPNFQVRQMKLPMIWVPTFFPTDMHGPLGRLIFSGMARRKNPGICTATTLNGETPCMPGFVKTPPALMP